jgi:hypothetical protein
MSWTTCTYSMRAGNFFYRRQKLSSLCSEQVLSGQSLPAHLFAARIEAKHNRHRVKTIKKILQAALVLSLLIHAVKRTPMLETVMLHEGRVTRWTAIVGGQIGTHTGFGMENFKTHRKDDYERGSEPLCIWNKKGKVAHLQAHPL